MLVMAYPKNKTGIKYYEGKFKKVEEYEAGMAWNTEGDRIEVWYDTNKYEEVVYRRFGEVLCMYDRFYTYMHNDGDDPIEKQIAAILKQEAIDNGYPMERPHKMTWRDIKVLIDALPEDVQDMPAEVWLAPKGGYERWTVDQEMFPAVMSITPYDEGAEPSVDNPLSINLENCC